MKWLKEFYGVDELSKPVLMGYFKKMIKRTYKTPESHVPNAIYMRDSSYSYVDSTPEMFNIKLYTMWSDNVYHLFLCQDSVVYEIGFMEDPEQNHIDNKCISKKRFIRIAEKSPEAILNKVADSGAMCHLSALEINNVTCDFDCESCIFGDFNKLQEFLKEG